jgi:hypothetical protein
MADGRGRSGPRHRHPPLPRAPEGQGNLDQLDRVDLCLDGRAEAPRQAGRQRATDARFAETLERVTVQTVEDGFMTKDLALLVGPDQKWLSTMGYLEKVDEYLNKALVADLIYGIGRQDHQLSDWRVCQLCDPCGACFH